MALNIVIDKSTFQSLSYDELLRLTYYYKHNITPVLVMEILGDLKKEEKNGNPPSQNRVIDFAKKLFPTNTIVNMLYTKPLKGELSGDDALEIDGRPLVEMGKTVQTTDGRKGWVVGETEEEKAIYSWREGKFSQADHDLSNLWRNTTTQEDLLINLKKELKEKGQNIKIAGFQELDAFVNDTIDKPENQQNLLIDLCKTSGVNAAISYRTLVNWQRAGQPLLKHFVPYAYHVLRVNTLFHVGLQCELIGTRPTNKVDLEYLYYLPFCQIFTSNDHLHLKLAPLLLRKDQHFIKGSDLKQDLKSMNELLGELSEDERDKFKKSPPFTEDSFTYQMYKQYFDYPKKWEWNRKVSEKETAEAIRMMKEFEKANAGEAIEMQKGDHGSFVTRKTFMGKDNPCFCGSGKKIINCCITEEQFNKVVIDQATTKQSPNK
jgi:hypothetical protein